MMDGLRTGLVLLAVAVVGVAGAEEGIGDLKRFDRAAASYTKAIQENPYSVEGYLRRGVAYRHAGNFEAAIQDYELAIRLDPRHPGGYNAKAWLLATCSDENFRQGPLALELAMTASQLAGPVPNADYLDTLAAAQAEVGRFADAVQTIQLAISLLTPQQGRESDVALLQKRLVGYQANQPWRQ